MPALAHSLIPPRFVFGRMELQLSCHLSTDTESTVSIGPRLRLTPLSASIVLGRRHAFASSCRFEMIVEQVAMHTDRLL